MDYAHRLQGTYFETVNKYSISLDREAVVGPEGPESTGAEMSLSRSVAEILSQHVTLEIEGIDTSTCTCLRYSEPEGWPAFSGFIGATSSPPAP